MLGNNREIQDPKLRDAIEEVREIITRYDLAGTALLVNQNEAAFTGTMFASWSAWIPDPHTPMGFRYRTSVTLDGPEVAAARGDGAIHIASSIKRFGQQMYLHMDDLLVMLRQAGVEFDEAPGPAFQRIHRAP